MRVSRVAAAAAVAIISTLGVATAHAPSHTLPAGPIRDRHELMEDIGRNAKIINDALKTGSADRITGAAEKIQASATKIPGLFPPGSTDPKSRAKSEIWANWDKFAANAQKLHDSAGALAAAARNNGDVKRAADDVFAICKSCHDDFRVPQKKK
jgi:cytochrome c556